MSDAYATIAPWYDTLIEPALGDLRRRGMALSGARPGTIVLDAACGTGAQLAMYRAAGCEVYGTDVSESMLAVARRRLGSEAVLLRADAAHMPFADGSVDLVLFSMALHEFAPSTRAAALEEARRVVRPDGGLLVLDYEAGAVSFPLGWFYRAGITCVEWMAGTDHFRHQRHYMASGGLRALAARHQLAVERAEIHRFGTFGVYLLRSAVFTGVVG